MQRENGTVDLLVRRNDPHYAALVLSADQIPRSAPLPNCRRRRYRGIEIIV